MLVTTDSELFERLRHLNRQGRAGEHPFWVTAIAPKYAMSNVQAAIALAQLERADALLEAKRRVHAWYREELGDVDLLQLSTELPNTSSAHWMTSVLVSEQAAVTRDGLADGLRRRGIETRPTYCALYISDVRRTGHTVSRCASGRRLRPEPPSGVDGTRRCRGRRGGGPRGPRGRSMTLRPFAKLFWVYDEQTSRLDELERTLQPTGEFAPWRPAPGWLAVRAQLPDAPAIRRTPSPRSRSASRNSRTICSGVRRRRFMRCVGAVLVRWVRCSSPSCCPPGAATGRG